MRRTKLGEVRTRFTIIRSKRQDSLFNFQLSDKIHSKYKKSHLCRNPMRQKSTDSGFDYSISLPSQNHTQYSLTDMVSSSSSLLPLPIDLHINTIGNTIRAWVPFGCLTKVTCCLNYTTTAALIVWQDDSRGFNYMPAEIDSLVEHLLAHDSHRSSYMLVSAIESLPSDAQLTRGLTQCQCWTIPKRWCGVE